MRSPRLQQQVDELVAQGWTIDHESSDRLVMINRAYGSLTSHVLVAILTIWWTMGLGNVLWAAYNYVAESERRVLWETGVGCPDCGADVPEGAEYCPGCGADVRATTADEIVCPDCDAVVQAGSRYCQACGTKLSEVLPQNT